ncbi:MAG: ATP synthase F0 subunit C [Defluviitaleaceae bacterium]|nr:ATP synthase F0 subunit C [Defluviitaleaceae bacterium]
MPEFAQINPYLLDEYAVQLVDTLGRVMVFSVIAAAIAVFVAASTAFGQGRIAAQAIDAIARQPEARGSITNTMILGLGLAETGGIYGLVVAILLLFANPLVNNLISLITGV